MRVFGCYVLGAVMPILMMLELVMFGVYHESTNLIVMTIMLVVFLFAALLINEVLIAPSVSSAKEAESSMLFLAFALGFWTLVIPYMEFDGFAGMAKALLFRVSQLISIML